MPHSTSRRRSRFGLNILSSRRLLYTHRHIKGRSAQFNGLILFLFIIIEPSALSRRAIFRFQRNFKGFFIFGFFFCELFFYWDAGREKNCVPSIIFSLIHPATHTLPIRADCSFSTFFPPLVPISVCYCMSLSPIRVTASVMMGSDGIQPTNSLLSLGTDKKITNLTRIFFFFFSPQRSSSFPSTNLIPLHCDQSTAFK